MEHILHYVAEHEHDWIELRRELHRIPELAWQEHATQRFILDRLDALGIEHRPCAGTGVVARVKGAKPGPVRAFRADIDARPTDEATGLPFASRNAGRMHACGHDAHMAVALGLAQTAATFREELCGEVMLVFQPAEEVMDGAAAMLADGAFAPAPPDFAVAFHVWNLPAGCVLAQPGPLMSESIFFTCTLTGQGGHGSQPHLCKNPISAAARIVPAWEALAATAADPAARVAFSVCQLTAGESHNAIPDTATLRGTLRVYDSAVGDALLEGMERIAAGYAGAGGVKARLVVDARRPAMVNDATLTEWIQKALAPGFGESLLTSWPAAMATEDFALFAGQAPGAMLWLGVADDPAAAPPLHNARFDINEAALAAGVRAFATLAFTPYPGGNNA